MTLRLNLGPTPLTKVFFLHLYNILIRIFVLEKWDQFHQVTLLHLCKLKANVTQSYLWFLLFSIHFLQQNNNNQCIYKIPYKKTIMVQFAWSHFSNNLVEVMSLLEPHSSSQVNEQFSTDTFWAKSMEAVHSSSCNSSCPHSYC